MMQEILLPQFGVFTENKNICTLYLFLYHVNFREIWFAPSEIKCIIKFTSVNKRKS